MLHSLQLTYGNSHEDFCCQNPSAIFASERFLVSSANQFTIIAGLNWAWNAFEASLSDIQMWFSWLFCFVVFDSLVICYPFERTKLLCEDVFASHLLKQSWKIVLDLKWDQDLTLSLSSWRSDFQRGTKLVFSFQCVFLLFTTEVRALQEQLWAVLALFPVSFVIPFGWMSWNCWSLCESAFDGDLMVLSEKEQRTSKILYIFVHTVRTVIFLTRLKTWTWTLCMLLLFWRKMSFVACWIVLVFAIEGKKKNKPIFLCYHKYCLFLAASSLALSIRGHLGKTTFSCCTFVQLGARKNTGIVDWNCFSATSEVMLNFETCTCKGVCLLQSLSPLLW